MTHTKTPWMFFQPDAKTGIIVRDSGHDLVGEFTPFGLIFGRTLTNKDKENIAFFLTACNSHDALFEAAKAALDELEKFTGEWSGKDDKYAPAWVIQWKPMITQLRAAIASAEPDKAEGGEG